MPSFEQRAPKKAASITEKGKKIASALALAAAANCGPFGCAQTEKESCRTTGPTATSVEQAEELCEKIGPEGGIVCAQITGEDSDGINVEGVSCKNPNAKLEEVFSQGMIEGKINSTRCTKPEDMLCDTE
ncbi:hypothetical protein HZC53_06400 [Candidatus Uhrbacteria bacterium]|nr:hypothetical protein [Candidatus Uhrbacteria bacterium]